MQLITASQLAHLKEGGAIGLTITVDPVEGAPVIPPLTEDDLLEGSFSVDRTWVSGGEIELGGAYATEIRFTLDNWDGRWNEVRWEGARLTVSQDIDGEPLLLGTFTVDEPPRSLETIEIRALDGMAKFNRAYLTNLSYPATLKQILLDACTSCGVNLYTQAFLNDDYTVTTAPSGEGITFHLVVSWVAELAGCNAWMDWEDRLCLSWYGDTQSETPVIGPDDRMDYQAAEDDIQLTGVIAHVGSEEYVVGTTDYAWVIEGNPLLQENVATVLGALYTKVGGFTYRPYTFQVLQYPHLWPGDLISILTPEGTTLSSCITTYSSEGSSSTLEAVGTTAQVRGYATGAPFTKSQSRVLQAVAQLEVSRQTTSLEQATMALNELMAKSMGSYLTKIESGGASIYYLHDRPLLEESSKIWMISEQGFAWTDQGWAGEETVWDSGITAEGNIIAKTLSVIGINADWINAGRIDAQYLRIGPGAEFDEGYNPSDKASLDDVQAARDYAEQQAAAAQSAAEAYAAQKAEAERVIAEAYADGIVDAEEQARIDDVNAKLATAKTYAEQQAAAAEAAAKTYAEQQAAAAQTAATSLLGQLANGTYSGGSFIDGTTLYSPAVVGMTGAFLSLLAGNPSAAHLQMGEADGNPYLQMYDTDNKLRVTLEQEYLKFTDPSGINLGYMHAYDGRMNIYTNTTAINSHSWIELWGDSVYPDRQGEIIMGADHFVWRIDGSTTSAGTEIMRLDNAGLSLVGNLSISGAIARGDNGRVNIYSNTTSKNSWAWMEFWGYDPDYGRSGEIMFGGSKFTVRLGSTDTSAGVDKLILDTAGLNAVDGLLEDGVTLSSKYAAKSHSHSYLPLSGGTLTGNVTTSGYVRADSGFRVGTAIGATATDKVMRYPSGYVTVTITSGIITKWTI